MDTATQQVMFVGSGAIATDPFFSNVVLLADFEGASGLSYIEQSPSAHTLTVSSSTDAGSQSNFSTTQAEYGSKSCRSNNTTGMSTLTSSDWNLSDANSSQLTIEYSYFQSSIATGNFNPFNNLTTFGSFSWLIRHAGADITLFWSSDGSTNQSLTASAAVPSVNTWHKYRISKNSAGKFRIFVNGVMVASSTPANSTMFHSGLSLGINQSGSTQTSYIDNPRITKGVCRDDSDSNYTLATGPFPTS
jgi:hypothetical protein